MTTPQEDPTEALAQETIEDALAPYRDVLPADLLEIVREQLEVFVDAHPEMVRLRRALAPRGEIDRSGTVGPDEQDAQPAPTAAGQKKA